jgi:K+-transporting ATPase ATPase C chain
MKILDQIMLSIKTLLLFTLITGVIYPLFITLVAQVFFSDKANGSLYVENGKVKGSFLIGQDFAGGKYFQSRPSAINYNPFPSGASNLGLTSKLLHEQFSERKVEFLSVNKLDSSVQVPSEMLFASASGVDPHISKQAAYLQVQRIAEARALDKVQEEELYKIIDSLVEYPQLGFLGNEVINVLKLNIKLDKIKVKSEMRK